ncbi:MAG TPA: SGNH/GDSL hydrolase family protein [Lautropia sp.]|nr:SGNH/GDSL hydrolase family protein [Lautropia sp.]
MTDTSSPFPSTPHGRFGRRLACLVAFFVLAIAGSTLAGPATAATPAPCPEAGKADFLQGEVPRFVARLGHSRLLRIVTIGSSSTAGAGASSQANSYPSQLESDLERRFPGRDIDVINAGANGQEAPDMLARLDRDVLAHAPDLVIWQFGSNGLMRGRPLAEMEEAARIGIERLRQAGIEVILMDLQHAPRIDGVPERDQVLRMMERLSVSSGAALFHRYQMMKAWASALGSGYAQMLSADQLHMTDTSYRCMADALASNLQRASVQRAARRRSGNLAAVTFPLQPTRSATPLSRPASP